METTNKISKWFTPTKNIVGTNIPSFRNSDSVRISKTEKNQYNVVALDTLFINSKTRKTVPSRIIAKFNGVQRLFSLANASTKAIKYTSMVGDSLTLVNSFESKPKHP